MKKILSAIFMLFSLIMFSCVGEVEEKPEDILPKDKFKQMVIDFHLLEAYVEIETQKDSSLAIFKKLEQDLYKKNNTSQKIYLKSYNYYLRNTEKDMNVIYEEIVNELSKMDARTRGQIKKTSKD